MCRVVICGRKPNRIACSLIVKVPEITACEAMIAAAVASVTTG